MTVESFLTRELQVRFIDARNLTTEAKLNLGVDGYPSEEQEASIIKEAMNIFQQRPDQVKADMKRLSISLETVKLSKSLDVDDSSRTESTSGSSTVSSMTSTRRYKLKFWSTRSN